MTLLHGTIIGISRDDDCPHATVRVSGACTRVPLMLVPDARVGDEIIMESGAAIATVQTVLHDQTRNNG